MSEEKNSIIREITPLSEYDCLYIADRKKKEFDYPIHTHEEYELNFIMNAAGATRIVGDSQETISDFDLVLIAGKELEHAWLQGDCKSEKDIREITIQFLWDFNDDSFLGRAQFNSIKKMMSDAQKGLSFPMEAILSVYPDLDSLSSETQGFTSVMKFLSVLYRLSQVEEARTLSSSSFANVRSGSDSRRVTKVQQYINENYQKNINLDTLASLAGMSAVAFSRYFKLRTGKTLSDYIIDVRLGHAARQLVDTAEGIGEICYACGFNNLSNFNRIFKKKKNCTPKEFRERYRKKVTRV
ncbi:MAG: AraC family transcriptional regulator [Bacteroidaceae bacterium]|nr:AraC family transcriptional regulator [Bacteroidaceae bacterium]